MQAVSITPSFATGFSSSNHTISTKVLAVLSREQSDIVMNVTCLKLLIKGAIFYHAGPKKDIQAMFDAVLMLNTVLLNTEGEICKFTALREDMELLRHFIECYLSYQEVLKTDRPMEFSADDYITGKLLLLDIREWQVSSVIYEEPTQDNID